MTSKALKYNVLNAQGKEVGTIDLDPAFFDVAERKELVHQVVRWQRAKSRSGTHSALTRAEVSGGGKKPWKQKGTGRARAGSNTSPLWVGGGKSHGPKPRSYEFSINKSERRLALLSTLSSKRRSESLRIIDQIKLASGKTKDAFSILKNIGVGRSKVTLIASAEEIEAQTTFGRALKNIANVKTLPVSALNVYDLLNARFVLGSKQAIEELQESLRKKAA